MKLVKMLHIFDSGYMDSYSWWSLSEVFVSNLLLIVQESFENEVNTYNFSSCQLLENSDTADPC